MAKYKFYVTGKVLIVEKTRYSGKIRNDYHDFDRIVYADSWQDAKEMVEEQLQNKYGKDTRYYEVVEFGVLSIDVFQLACEKYNWELHKRAGLGDVYYETAVK